MAFNVIGTTVIHDVSSKSTMTNSLLVAVHLFLVRKGALKQISLLLFLMQYVECVAFMLEICDGICFYFFKTQNYKWFHYLTIVGHCVDVNVRVKSG